MASPLAVRVYARSRGRSQIQTPGLVLAEGLRISDTATRSFPTAEDIVYVNGSTGSDSNSITAARNPSTPKATISDALADLGSSAPDVVVQVASGTYTAALNTWPSGTSGHPFILRAATQYGAIVKPNGGSSHVIGIDGDSYITVDGLTIDGDNVSSNNVEFGNATGIILQNCEVKNTEVGVEDGGGSFQGIQVRDTCAVITLRNNLIHDIAVAATTHFNQAIYFQADDGLIEGNTIYNIGGFGIQQYPSGSNNVIRNNTIYDFGMGDALQNYGIYFAGSGSGNVAYNNVIYLTSGANASSTGAIVSCATTALYNNTIYNMTLGGIEADDATAIIRNNVVYNPAFGFPLVDYTGGAATMNTNLTTDPDFVNAAAANFHLLSTSDARDAGATIGTVATDKDGLSRPQGSAYCLGAYEYV